MTVEPLTSGLLSILAAGVAGVGAYHQRQAQISADREKEQHRALEARVKLLEEKNHAQDLVLVRLEGDLRHMRSSLDEALGLLRQLAAPAHLRGGA